MEFIHSATISLFQDSAKDFTKYRPPEANYHLRQKIINRLAEKVLALRGLKWASPFEISDQSPRFWHELQTFVSRLSHDQIQAMQISRQLEGGKDILTSKIEGNNSKVSEASMNIDLTGSAPSTSSPVIASPEKVISEKEISSRDPSTMGEVGKALSPDIEDRSRQNSNS